MFLITCDCIHYLRFEVDWKERPYLHLSEKKFLIHIFWHYFQPVKRIQRGRNTLTFDELGEIIRIWFTKIYMYVCSMMICSWSNSCSWWSRLRLRRKWPSTQSSRAYNKDCFRSPYLSWSRRRRSLIQYATPTKVPTPVAKIKNAQVASIRSSRSVSRSVSWNNPTGMRPPYTTPRTSVCNRDPCCAAVITSYALAGSINVLVRNFMHWLTSTK